MLGQFQVTSGLRQQDIFFFCKIFRPTNEESSYKE
jgi:hypothetical protein